MKNKSKNSIIGFTFSSVTDSFRDPKGALILHTEPGKLKVVHCSMKTLYEKVQQGQIADAKLKDGKLMYTVVSKNKAATDTKAFAAGSVATAGAGAIAVNSFGAGTAVATTATEAAAISTAITADAAAGAAVVGTATAAEVATGAAVEVEVLAASTAIATTATEVGASAVALSGAAVGAAVAGGVVLGAGLLYGGFRLVSGVINQDTLFDNANVRFIDNHFTKATLNDDVIAVSICDLQRKKDKLGVTLICTGKSLGAFITNIVNKYPSLSGKIKGLTSDYVVLTIPMSVLSKGDFGEGFKLLYNTQVLHDAKSLEKLEKVLKKDSMELSSLAHTLDDITEKNLKSLGTVENTEQSVDSSNLIKQYFEKYNIPEESQTAELNRLKTVFHVNSDAELAPQLKLMMD